MNEYAQGRVWTGAQAYEIGLIDGLGGMETAKENMQQLLGKKVKSPWLMPPLKEGVKISFNISEMNTFTPLKAYNAVNNDYIKLYELWEDYAGDKALMISPELPEILQF